MGSGVSTTGERPTESTGSAAPPRGLRLSSSRTGGVLRTRLVPPRLPRVCLPRPARVERVLRGMDGRLVAIIAGAGYGKSTLLAQALAEVRMPWVWLGCDERISGTREFLAHLAVGLSGPFPGFAAALELDGTLDNQVGALGNELLAVVADDYVLAIDDVHAIAGSPAAEALALLVRDLPPGAHLALAGRSAMPFPLGRLRAGGVVVLGESELALSPDETADIVRASRPELGPEAADGLHRRTEGWVAGLLLALQSEDPLHASGSLVTGAHFEYLAEEVLERLAPELRRFIVQTAVLDRFTPALAAAVSERSDARELIGRLQTEHLFLIPLADDGEWYRYHHLFGAFLRTQLAREEDSLEALHRRAAQAWQRAGEPVEALRHWLEAGDHAAAVDALEQVAEQMVTTPQAQLVADWLDQIPRTEWADRPGIVLAHASLLFGRGRLEEAIAGLEEAIETLLALGEAERAAVALFRLFRTLSTLCQNERAQEAAERFLGRLPDDAPAAPAARLMVACAHAQACRYEDFEAEVARALASPAAANLVHFPLFAHAVRAYMIEHFQGRSREALASIEAVIAELEAEEVPDWLGTLPWSRVFRMFVLAHLGRWEEALESVRAALAAAEQAGLLEGFRRVTPFATLSCLVRLGRWDELDEALREAVVRPAFDGTVFAARYHATLAQRATHRADIATVRAEIEAARATPPSLYQALVLSDLARTAWEAGLDELAREVVGEAEEVSRIARSPWAQAQAALVGAAAWGGGSAGDALLLQALEITEQHAYEELWSRRNAPIAGPLLARALRAGLGPPGLAARLAAACGADVVAGCAAALADGPAAGRAQLAEVALDVPGVDPGVIERLLGDPDPTVRAAVERAGARIAAAPRPHLRLIGLGRFAVLRGEAAIPNSAFGRERARALLAALLCAGRLVHREQLLEWFWPKLAPDRAVRAFHVTLYELRRAIEPESPRRKGVSRIVAEGENYRLALDPGDSFDCDEFLALARAPEADEDGEARLGRLQAAERAYTGELFPDWRYAEWAQARRAEVDAIHRAVVAELAEALIQAGQPAAGVTRYQRLVALEPEREAWHRGLMRAFADAGERALALRQYHACRAVLRRELGVEASDETRALYQTLLG